MTQKAAKAPESEEATSTESGRVPVETEEGSAAPSMVEQAWQPIMSLRREMDRLFDDFFSRGVASWGRGGEFDPFRRFEGMLRPSAPAMDLVEREKEYVVTAELPGLDEKALEVKLLGDVLSISGQKEEERKEERERYRMAERRYGSFQRSLQLPQDVDPEKIDARFTKGVLTLTLPKSEEAVQKQKKIEVKAE
ncbi:MAG TPA: Hsp20/alpha crystallin family protein [Candidatus Limnocylindria bacterium]|nr:Hsp20/alpha crystallin family protein [Candidatus Limnocylindria bacterium]